MNNAITFFGWFCVALLCLAFCAFAVSLAAFLVSKALERYEWAVDAKTRHDVGRRIKASAHWFAESQDTGLAMRILGQRLIEGFDIDPDKWRQEWRRDRRADNGTEVQK